MEKINKNNNQQNRQISLLIFYYFYTLNFVAFFLRFFNL